MFYLIGSKDTEALDEKDITDWIILKEFTGFWDGEFVLKKIKENLIDYPEYKHIQLIDHDGYVRYHLYSHLWLTSEGFFTNSWYQLTPITKELYKVCSDHRGKLPYVNDNFKRLLVNI